MRGSFRFLSSLVLLASCVRQEEGLTGTTSLRVQIIQPGDLGDPDRPIDTERTVEVAVTALDADGNIDRGFDFTVDVVTQFLGTLSGPRGKITLTEGVGQGTVVLPRAFGPTYLWVEDADESIDGRPPTFATGTSTTIYYRFPWVTDAQTPDLTRPSIRLERSPMEGKQVEIVASQFGANGRLIVTWVGAQGFTMSDVNCADPEIGPCSGVGFGHILVFTFGLPRASDGTDLEVGHVIRRVAGGLSEFNGLTELNFPEVSLVSSTPRPGLLPAPVVVDRNWLRDMAADNGMINLEANESGLVSVGNGCGSQAMNVVTQGAVQDFDPATIVGARVQRIVGTLRAVNIGSFSVWIMQPRNGADLTL
jgi:hypothetical protein